MNLSKEEEYFAIKLNRLFAAVNSLRSRNPVGYEKSRKELDAFREKLEAGDPDRMKRIVLRTEDLSSGTFHWNP